MSVAVKCTVNYVYLFVNDVIQGMTSAASAEVPAVSGRTVHRGPPVRPGSGEPVQVQITFVFTGLAGCHLL